MTYKVVVIGGSDFVGSNLSEQLGMIGGYCMPVDPLKELKNGEKFDSIIITVKHKQLQELSVKDLRILSNLKPALIDVREFIDRKEAHDREFYYNRL